MPPRASGISRPSSARPAGSSASCRTCSTWRGSKAAAWRSIGGCSRSSACSRRSFAATSASSATRRIVARTSVDDAADQVLGDPDRLEQVIENLFANAVRHAPDGSTVELRAESGDGAVRLSVTDQGSGIGADHLPHVFDRFYKVDAGRAAGDGRSGLGLSIVKAIVEQHGGQITVSSAPGRTEFVIELPQPSTIADRRSDDCS